MKTQEEIEKLADEIYGEYAGYHKASFTNGYTKCQEDMADKIEVNSPNPNLIDSMAMRYRHDFGLLDKQQQDSIRTTMIQLWEEVVGKGFYSLNKQD